MSSHLSRLFVRASISILLIALSGCAYLQPIVCPPLPKAKLLTKKLTILRPEPDAISGGKRIEKGTSLLVTGEIKQSNDGFLFVPVEFVGIDDSVHEGWVDAQAFMQPTKTPRQSGGSPNPVDFEH